MNAKTLEAITRHGKTLLAAFPHATEKDPVALCRKLRRIESAVSRFTTAFCNGEIESPTVDIACHKALARTARILGLDESGITRAGLFINRDPRGCALKLQSPDESPWFADWQLNRLIKHQPQIVTDMGGYGLLAPDLNQ